MFQEINLDFMHLISYLDSHKQERAITETETFNKHDFTRESRIINPIVNQNVFVLIIFTWMLNSRCL